MHCCVSVCKCWRSMFSAGPSYESDSEAQSHKCAHTSSTTTTQPLSPTGHLLPSQPAAQCTHAVHNSSLPLLCGFDAFHCPLQRPPASPRSQPVLFVTALIFFSVCLVWFGFFFFFPPPTRCGGCIIPHVLVMHSHHQLINHFNSTRRCCFSDVWFWPGTEQPHCTQAWEIGGEDNSRLLFAW